MDVENGNNALATARANLEQAATEATLKVDTPTEQVESTEPFDLKKAGKFIFEGKEVTYDDLKKSHMLQSDYTKKTTEIANERRYVENLSYDLDHIANDPSKLAQFKQVYPEKYWQAADRVAATSRGKVLESQEEKPSRKDDQRIDPKVVDEIADIKARLDMSERQKARVVIDKIVGELGGKYELADQDLIQAKAAFIMQQSGQFLPLKEWENLFKESHTQTLEKSSRYLKAILQKQKEANAQAKDVSTGGMALGKGEPKTFEEAQKAMYGYLSKK